MNDEIKAGQDYQETVEQVLTHLVRFYEERCQASHQMANRMSSNPSMQLHHALDAYGWSSKASAVRKVAEKLEIHLPAPAAVEEPAQTIGPLLFTPHFYLDGLELCLQSKPKSKGTEG